jgi:hypothetical protein
MLLPVTSFRLTPSASVLALRSKGTCDVHNSTTRGRKTTHSDRHHHQQSALFQCSVFTVTQKLDLQFVFSRTSGRTGCSIVQAVSGRLLTMEVSVRTQARPVSVKFVVDKVTLGKVLLGVDPHPVTSVSHPCPIYSHTFERSLSFLLPRPKFSRHFVALLLVLHVSAIPHCPHNI